MFDPDAYLTDGLATFAQMWISEFRDHFELDATEPPEDHDPGEWGTLYLLDDFAEHLTNAVKSLDGSKGDFGAVINRMREEHDLDLSENRFFVQALETHLAEEIEDDLYRMTRRSLKLAQFLVHIRHERARAYLSRVGACYLRGLEPETVIMCGAVLDSALQEEFEDDEVRASGVRCGKYVSLGNRIEYALKTEIFDERIAETAFSIAGERNDAIHTVPGLSRPVEDVMRDLVTVLSIFDSGSSAANH